MASFEICILQYYQYESVIFFHWPLALRTHSKYYSWGKNKNTFKRGARKPKVRKFLILLSCLGPFLVLSRWCAFALVWVGQALHGGGAAVCLLLLLGEGRKGRQFECTWNDSSRLPAPYDRSEMCSPASFRVRSLTRDWSLVTDWQ